MNEDSGKWGNLLLRSPSYDDLFQDYLQNDEIMDMDTEASEDFLTDLVCRCSMIMSVVNCSVKMSVWGYGKDTDIERGRAEAVGGLE